LQQPVIRDLSMQVTLEHMKERSGPKPLKNVCEPFSLILPLEHELTVKHKNKEILIAPRSAPLLCLPEIELVTEAEFPFLLLRPKQAAQLRARIPAFRYFWEETLELPIPNRSGK
jgi:hypothetical protein